MPLDAEDWDDAEDDDDTDDASWEEEDEPTIACPYCRAEIHEDAQRCPECGHYISEEDQPAQRRPWWIVVGVVVCLALVYLWITR
jgi:predicted nucleic acid-binding Zn ribbon protein